MTDNNEVMETETLEEKSDSDSSMSDSDDEERSEAQHDEKDTAMSSEDLDKLDAEILELRTTVCSCCLFSKFTHKLLDIKYYKYY